MTSAPRVTLHVSVWVEIIFICSAVKLTMSRSTWACELKLILQKFPKSTLQVTLHVSVWVEIVFTRSFHSSEIVTLHVSVWVEIYPRKWHENGAFVTLHVSVWVEMDVLRWRVAYDQVTLHVSVWVEIWQRGKTLKISICHAPRERVSWNNPFG